MNLKLLYNEISWKKLFAFFSIVWLMLNILQALFTEIHSDEAYYWLWGQHLAWGYYDHPPMVALFTHISSLLFSGELSVRFLTIVVQYLTLVVIWKLIDEKNPSNAKVTLFFVLMGSMPMFNVYGFVTTPDVPFLFFVSIFLYGYKNFTNSDSWKNAIFLGIAIAGMFYSKYHAFIIFGLIVLSNFRLLLNYKAWIALFIAIALLLPHIFWQINMDFPSFKYHLAGRNMPFEWYFLLDYLPNQMVIFNPVAFIAIIVLFVRRKTINVFERSLYFLIIGFFVFFWPMAFKSHIEPHWTVASTIPMVYLLYKYALEEKNFGKKLMKYSIPVVVLMLIARVVLVIDILPSFLGFYGKEEYSKAIKSVAGDLPVVFTGSFQTASEYAYFTQSESLLLSGVDSRLTQFDIWQKELDYQGQKVFVCSDLGDKSTQYNVGNNGFLGTVINGFQSVNRVQIEFSLDSKELYIGKQIDMKYSISNPTNIDINFNHKELPVTPKLALSSKGEVSFYPVILKQQIDILQANSSIQSQLSFIVPDVPEGKYQIAITLDNIICGAHNSNFENITILK